ncbi:MAG TPA: DUF4383 domain-containing protein [Bacillus sp. (in: firmicutes)]|uniref:DUF4383 domain-containing protein n=1 Tax=Bacillus litorisediminis TaxID=2922713 RepID=UPI001FABE1D4|nr:DUF4383 domain-containing protein [Bacillus litorisediminis]HWO76668.1 DUF4383 domain-containing protein [Bacillus sp. (in: firmicutes)]
MSMKQKICLVYVRLISILFIIQASFGIFQKLYEGRTDDLVHNILHALIGIIGALSSFGENKFVKSRKFLLGLSLFYFCLGLIGWFWPNPFGLIPLGVADNIFHVLVGLLSFAVYLTLGERKTGRKNEW